jgi:hypothetical protein
VNVDDCWLWDGRLNAHGYGVVSVNGRNLRVHRLSYEQSVGEIPAGMTVDHLCHNTDESCPGGSICLHRRCWRPDHLEAVPPGVNVLRGRGPSAGNARKTHCDRGHPFDDANTYWWKGSRACRACRVERGEILNPGSGLGGVNKSKTHCVAGHPFDEANTLVRPNGRRVCRACARQRAVAAYHAMCRSDPGYRERERMRMRARRVEQKNGAK